jgi:Ankyrin repeats (3 copies)
MRAIQPVRLTVLMIFTVSAFGKPPAVPQLHQDLQNGDIAALRQHIEQGANLAERDAYGLTPLHRALDLGKRDMAIELIQRGADISARTRNGASPLSLAVDKGFVDVVDLLLDRHAATESPGAAHSPMFSAVDSGNREILDHLVRGGAMVNSRNGAGESPLFRAATLGHLDIAQRLLDLGSDINAALPDGRTALHAAVLNMHPDVAELLYSRGAAVTAAGGEVGTYASAIAYRFVAEKEYLKREPARAAEHLQLAQAAFVASHAILEQQSKVFAGQVSRLSLLNFSLLLGQLWVNTVKSPGPYPLPNGALAGTGGQQSSLRDSYKKLADWCTTEAARMNTIGSCVTADSNGEGACFSSPAK